MKNKYTAQCTLSTYTTPHLSQTGNQGTFKGGILTDRLGNKNSRFKQAKLDKNSTKRPDGYRE